MSVVENTVEMLQSQPVQVIEEINASKHIENKFDMS